MTNELNRHAAVVGLGSMGGAMAATLHRAGWSVSGFDPSSEARSAAAANGIAVVEDVAELAGTPYVVLSLPSAAIVRATVPHLLTKPGTVAIVDTTTSEPATSAEMAGLAQQHRAHFVDSPVSGGNAGAATGMLSAFLGGSEDSIEAARPVLDALTGGQYTHIGPIGSGNVVKLLNNILCATNLAAVGEALDIAAAYGIDLGIAAQAISGASGGSKVSSAMFPNWILSGTFDSGFALGLMARDVSLALDVAAQHGAAPQVLSGTNQAWQKALAELGPKADFVQMPSTVTTATDALSPTAINAAKESASATR
ncbi:NAD(P)-dependent oxidoreductase [Arthrobacter sp. M4]|uniref:NAD(P)-dependent oxidoreductase n=1 Tax=Arthrobacter sp. M4 TaxID=218160 RepID=UPI001CDB9E50|nr:NAD(P)-dependent oxidoreductase [Arthrobacter sp. M4]MCA4133963.1 NAD(P)-dependent oxidoreductase [Arthrobacter sp. M4]